MPVCDGRQMLQEIEARELDCEILVLSEYSDFEYMHQAIHAHVADYLLKPIDSEQLNDLLRNAALRLDEKRRLNHVSRDPLSKIFVSAASEGRPGAYEEICRKYATGFAKTALQVCSIQFCADSKSYPVILQKVNLLIKDAPFPTRVLPYSESCAIFCLFSSFSLPNSAGTAHRYQDWLRKFLQQCRKELDMDVRAGICNSEEHIIALRERIRDSMAALLFLHNGRGDFIRFESVMRTTYSNDEVPIGDHPLTELLSCGKDNREKLYQVVLQSILKSEYVYLPAVRKSLVNFTLALERCARRAGHAVNITSLLGENYIDRINKLEWLPEIEVFLRTVLDETFQQMLSKRSLETDGVVSEVLRTVETRNMDDLSLLNFSNQYHFNYIYLSRKFKERTGDTFTDYLLRIRMSKARELIEQGGFSEKEAAPLVGYSNPYYFISSYRKCFHSDDKERQEPDGKL